MLRCELLRIVNRYAMFFCSLIVVLFFYPARSAADKVTAGAVFSPSELTPNSVAGLTLRFPASMAKAWSWYNGVCAG